MADGSSWLRTEDGRALRLREVGGGESLVAVCGCGGESLIDVSQWLRQGLGDQPLPALEPRLRCACGARTVRLEVRSAGEARTAAAGPYLFR